MVYISFSSNWLQQEHDPLTEHILKISFHLTDSFNFPLSLKLTQAVARN